MGLSEPMAVKCAQGGTEEKWGRRKNNYKISITSYLSGGQLCGRSLKQKKNFPHFSNMALEEERSKEMKS